MMAAMQVHMHRFSVLAQSMTGDRRITRTVSAWSELHVVRLVSAELHEYGYFIVDVRQGEDCFAVPLPSAVTRERSGHPVPAVSIYDEIV
jgi:hypothetical protein